MSSNNNINNDNLEVKRVLTQFKHENGEMFGSPLDIPIDISVDQMQLICNAILQTDEQTPYVFFAKDTEITETLRQTLQLCPQLFESEKCLEIVCCRESLFRVEAVTRCSSTIPGHTEAVISVCFSPDGRHLASGSGDTTVRFWDLNTETPHFTCKAHKHWVLAIAWSPNATKLASACKNGTIFIWDAKTGNQVGKALYGHKDWIYQLCWEPFHCNTECRRFASASADQSVKIWDALTQRLLFTLNGHTSKVTCVKWGGTGLIYTGSQDRTIKVWTSDNGTLCRTLESHGHWINSISLSTDYVLRTAAFEADDNGSLSDIACSESKARERYLSVRGETERLVSCSDDFTLILWHPESDKKPISRMTGHLQLINDIKFSPDSRLIASASFDKSIKLWDGKSGTFKATLRGHVKAVYQIAWSSDSRLLVSGSADSTLKVWDIGSKTLLNDLPGHSDEVYALDWSPNGHKVASGGKDKVLKIWRR